MIKQGVVRHTGNPDVALELKRLIDKGFRVVHWESTRLGNQIVELIILFETRA